MLAGWGPRQQQRTECTAMRSWRDGSRRAGWGAALRARAYPASSHRLSCSSSPPGSPARSVPHPQCSPRLKYPFAIHRESCLLALAAPCLGHGTCGSNMIMLHAVLARAVLCKSFKGEITEHSIYGPASECYCHYNTLLSRPRCRISRMLLQTTDLAYHVYTRKRGELLCLIWLGCDCRPLWRRPGLLPGRTLLGAARQSRLLPDASSRAQSSGRPPSN